MALKSGVPLVRALDRGLALLSAFTPNIPELSLTELSRSAMLDKGTTRRLLQTLELNGFVSYDRQSATFSLSHKILSLASAVKIGAALRKAAAGTLRSISAQTNATSFLWIYDDGKALCLDRVQVDLPNFDTFWFSIGGRATLNSGAGPRVLLAYIDAAERQYALSFEMEKRTSTAETQPELLIRQAERIRRRGWELAVNDFLLGFAGLGVPILSSQGSLLGALSISTITGAYGDHKHPAHLDLLTESAAAIGSTIGN